MSNERSEGKSNHTMFFKILFQIYLIKAHV